MRQYSICSPGCGCWRCRSVRIVRLGETYEEEDLDEPRQRQGPRQGRAPRLGEAVLRPPPLRASRWQRPSLPVPQLRLPPYEVIDGFALNQPHLLPGQRTRVQSLAQRIVASWRTTSPVTRIRLVGYVHNSETTPNLDQRRVEAVQSALVSAISALNPGLVSRIQFEPGHPAGVTAQNPRVEIFAWMGLGTPSFPPLPPRIPPPSEAAREYLQRRGEFGPETIEQRINRILRTAPPARPAGRSFTQYFWQQVDSRLNDVMRRVGIPGWLQGHLRRGAHAAIERGASALFDQILDAADLRGEPREAVSGVVRALLQTPVR